LSREALQFVEGRIALHNARSLRSRLNVPGAAGPVILVRPDRTAVKASEEGQEFGFLAALVPLILILMTITGAVYPAIDLTAGELERGTLEILVAAPVPRLALLFAKYVSVLTVALLTAVINLITMLVTLFLSGLLPVAFQG